MFNSEQHRGAVVSTVTRRIWVWTQVQPGLFCMELACSLCHVGFFWELWLPPTVWRHAVCDSKLPVGVWFVYFCISIVGVIYTVDSFIAFSLYLWLLFLVEHCSFGQKSWISAFKTALTPCPSWYDAPVMDGLRRGNRWQMESPQMSQVPQPGFSSSRGGRDGPMVAPWIFKYPTLNIILTSDTP